MRPNRLIAAVLCLTVALPPGAFAQAGAGLGAQSAGGATVSNALNVPNVPNTSVAPNTSNVVNTPNASTAPLQSPIGHTAASPLTTALASPTTPTATIDANVFGLYGGAETRLANRPGEKAG